MGFTDSAPKISGNYHTVDRATNRYSSKKNGSQKLDYCMYKFPNQPSFHHVKNELLFVGDEAISDHMAWSSTYRVSYHNPDADETSIAAQHSLAEE